MNTKDCRAIQIALFRRDIPITVMKLREDGSILVELTRSSDVGTFTNLRFISSDGRLISVTASGLKTFILRSL